jgi:lysophospholipase L1-like esterase
MEWATVEGVGDSVTSVVGETGDVTGLQILADTDVASALSAKADAASLGTAAAADTTDFDAAGAAAAAQSAAIAASAPLGAAGPPLSILLAALATRTSTPCRIVFAGSSTTVGTGASDTAHSYVSLLVAALQNAYPSGLGSEAAVVASTSATWGTPSTDPGVHGFNMGEGGTTSANYFTSGERTSTAAISPACVVHMIGANDFSTGVVPATYGTNVAAVVNGLKALVSTPMVQVLAHTYQRMDVAEPAYPWADYLAQLQAIADADPDNVVCVDASAVYAAVGVPGADPWNLINVDDIHQGDAGHALTAELLWRSLIGSPRTFAGAFAPLVESVNTVAASGDTETLPDSSVKSISRVTLTASCTFTMPTATAGKSFTVVLVQGGSGSYTATFTGALWAAGTAPTLSTAVGAVDVVTFLCADGSTWMGFAAGLDMS